MRIRVVALKTCQRRWTTGKSGERGPGISVLAARHDDDDNEGYKHRSKEEEEENLHVRASRRAETKERGSYPTDVCYQKEVGLVSGIFTWPWVMWLSEAPPINPPKARQLCFLSQLVYYFLQKSRSLKVLSSFHLYFETFVFLFNTEITCHIIWPCLGYMISASM